MVTVFNNIDRVAGNPLESVLVTIELVWDTSVSPVVSTDGDTMIRASYGTETDSAGNWEVSLVPNDEITPSGSLYKITERLDGSNDSVVYYIDVVSSATPSSWVGDILASEPDYV